METRILGSTGIEVSSLCFGTLTMSPMQKRLGLSEGANVILAALEKGVNFIDTAQMYGSYPQVNEALRQWKGPMPTVASKSAAKTYEDMAVAVAECLEKTGLQKVDLFLLHAVKDSDDFVARSGALAYLAEAKKSGLIKAIGASSHSASTIRFLAENDAVEVLHPMYNRDGIGILDASLDEMTEILKFAKGKGRGIYAMKPLGGGHLARDARSALRWVFSSPVIDSVAIGMTSVAEVEMNVALAEGQEITDGAAAEVAGQIRHLFINHMICARCAACVQACQQQALSVNNKGAVEVDHGKCVLCGYCAPVCPKFAIRIV